MKSWLFTWNPRLWAWDDPVYGYKEMIREVESTGATFCKWTCGVTKTIEPGDRVFLIRLGVEPRGIIASGHALTAVFEGTHWDPDKAAQGKKANRIYIKFDKLLDCDSCILSMDELKRISGAMHWSPQSSGVSIPDDVASRLEELWQAL